MTDEELITALNLEPCERQELPGGMPGQFCLTHEVRAGVALPHHSGARRVRPADRVRR